MLRVLSSVIVIKSKVWYTHGAHKNSESSTALQKIYKDTKNIMDMLHVRAAPNITFPLRESHTVPLLDGSGHVVTSN